jgi:hypothetical protein
VQLQVLFVDRPAGDPLLRQLVWQEVDQVGAAPPAQRALLLSNGLRVAQCGASVPPALQTLLGISTEIGDTDAAAMRGRQLNLLSGQDSEVLINEEPRSCTLRFELPEQVEVLEFEQARGLLRVRPVRLRDGWVRLEFTPEIHHGDSRMRHKPTDNGWELRAGQKTDERHALKFQVTLNTGEMVLVGAAGNQPESFGRQFFCHEYQGRAQERLLVIRLADAGRPAANGNEP